MLWESYETSEGMISGISAMPSMHVATAVLFFLCARGAGIAWLSWATGIFAVMIQIGSVLLAWHYAVDGYAGALLALGCWWLAGWWVKRGWLSSRPS
jgi:membrane-associated phospholipid phosphatase